MLRQRIALIQRVSLKEASQAILRLFKNYANVFSNKKATTLLELSKTKHVIKTIADLPFKLLYNLFIVQLKAL